MQLKHPIAVGCIITLVALVILHAPLLRFLGHFLIEEDIPEHAQASVVLSTGVEYPYRLIEAANLYKREIVDYVVINGNRKTAIVRHLESLGYQSAAPWHENSLRILGILGVPRKNVLIIDAEDAYDTISEAKAVCSELPPKGITRVIVTTSKSHTKRAGFIWKSTCPEEIEIHTAAARKDPYDPNSWWKDGRQIRWVLAEYGAWFYYFWKKWIPEPIPPS